MLQRMVEAKAIFQENLQLKAALQLRQHERDTVAVGRIVGSSFNSPRRFAILSAGAQDGVREGMPVRSPDGLVGRIIDVGTLASRVLLVSDRTSIVPARLLRSGIPVIVAGPRRRDGRGPSARGRPQSVQARRSHHHVGHRRALSAARADRAGVKLNDDGAIALPLADPSTTSFAIVEPPFEPAAIAADKDSAAETP